MGSKGVKSADWKQVTNKVGSTTSDIGKFKELKISVTTLSPFVEFKSLTESFNASLKSLKAYTTADVKKMNAAGDNKSKDDSAAGKTLKSGGGK